MNEAKMSQIYRDFVKKSWDSFDCAIVVMDACQGVNTQEQVDLLKFVKLCNQTYKNIPIIILCNKVDDEMNSELMTLVHEVQSEVEAIFEVSNREEALQSILSGDTETNPNGNDPVISPIFMHISAENAFVYRTASKLTKDTIHTMEKIYFDKIGYEEIGKVKWNRLSNEEKYQLVLNIISDPEQYRERLRSSIFDKLLKVLEYVMGDQEKQQTIVEKQIEVLLKKISESTDVMTSLSNICNLQMNIKKPVDGIVERFWYLYNECKAKAIEKFEVSPWKVNELSHPMKQLICFHSFLSSNMRLKGSMSLSTWTNNITRAHDSMIDLICEQLSIISSKLTNHQDCGKCDPWFMLTLPFAPTSSHSFYSNTIWFKVGSSTPMLCGSHPDPKSRACLKAEDEWEGLSRSEKVAICHSILLLKYDNNNNNSMIYLYRAKIAQRL